MRPFWDDLKRTFNATGPDESTALIDTDAAQPEQLELSTLGDKSPILTHARLASGIEEVDSEGFTSHDASHITHN